ncbi:TPA: hypothetical protein VOS29_000297 [Streptococcus pyogenes]|uniref:hypothetical protein n=1 Tax=Atopobium minutum TaxID=1381 RepID=UPI00290D4AC4|nr:hypothetical protein [Atopobium minutum]MDU5357424.1 hypothetical protein [Atopobium minutum]HES5012756.1 hypothetical protein [Streptococcus pyogenes]
MANVKTYLSKILSAVYGKDVRGAIHDSIAAINQQVETTTSGEANRVQAEKERASAETSRKNAETERTNAEALRQNAESSRNEDEKKRENSTNELKSRMNEKLNTVDQKISEMQNRVQEAIDAVPKSVLTLDATLSKEGYAADAKTTGDAIAVLRKGKERKIFPLTSSNPAVVFKQESYLIVEGPFATLYFTASIRSLTDNSFGPLLALCVSPIKPASAIVGTAFIMEEEYSRPLIMLETGALCLMINPNQSSATATNAPVLKEFENLNTQDTPVSDRPPKPDPNRTYTLTGSIIYLATETQE